MSLRDAIDGVESREKTLTVYDSGSSTNADELSEQFDSQAVAIREGTTDGTLDGFAVLSEDGEVLSAIDLDHLSRPRVAGLGERRAFSGLIDRLDETLFTSYDADQMLATAREIEDRAWRAGVGSLHAGFQRTEAVSAQRDVYERLAATDLDVSVYTAPDDRVPDVEGVEVVRRDTAELRNCWFVVYDGGGDALAQCALLAEERGDREFYGFWTYDPGLVGDLLDHLSNRYATAAV